MAAQQPGIQQANVEALEKMLNAQPVMASSGNVQHLLQQAVAELDRCFSQWEVKRASRHLHQHIALLQEAAPTDARIEAFRIAVQMFYGCPQTASERAFAYLNAQTEQGLAKRHEHQLDALVHLALGHYFTMRGQAAFAFAHLQQASTNRSGLGPYRHLVLHRNTLTHQALRELPQSKALKWFEASQNWWRRATLALASVGTLFNVASLWKTARVVNELLNLLWLELLRAPYPQVAESFKRILDQAYLVTVIIHAVQSDMAHGQWKPALIRVRRAIRRMPSQPLLWLELARVYNSVGAGNKAFFAQHQAVALMPSHPQAQLELAIHYAERGAMVQAMEHLMLAYLNTRERRQKRKVAYLMTHLLEQPPRAEAETPDAAELAQWRDLSAEIALLLKLEQEPRPGAATLSHLAKLATGLNQYRLAVTLCERALQADTEQNPQCLINLAYTLWQSRQVQRARYLYQQALASNPANPVAHNNLGCILLDDLHLPERALQHFKQALRHDANYAMAQFNLGRVYAQQGAYTEAAQAFACARATNVLTRELDADEIETQLHQLFDKM